MKRLQTVDQRLPTSLAAHLEDHTSEEPWLVDSLWLKAAVGLIGGAPKCCKSWLGLDLALSIASGTRCLDTFDVADVGPVLLYMAEDAGPLVKARLAGLCRHRGLDLADVPIHVITCPSLRIDIEHERKRLDETIRYIKPRLLLLDPFVRLHRIDENNAGEVSALLAYLRTLQRVFDLAIAVVHHSRKNHRAGAPGQNLRGSGDFHAWADSSLYLRRQRDQLLLTPEHRSAPALDALAVELITDAEGNDPHLEITDAPPALTDARRDIDAEIVVALRSSPVPMARAQLRTLVRIRNQTLGHALQRLTDAGRIQATGHRWTVPVPRLL